jgi:hypothetical protein
MRINGEMMQNYFFVAPVCVGYHPHAIDSVRLVAFSI